MKYEPPYGVADPNASYINGNPSTGTMGSIPPAASIENPQREIVNFETDSGLTPTDGDLHQLSKSVQGGVVNYATDAGSPNFIAITLTPALNAYSLGLRLVIKVGYTNTANVKINANGIGFVSLLHSDLTELGQGEIKAGQMIEAAWDGTQFQMLSGGGGGLVMMTAPRTFYVDPNIGDDTRLRRLAGNDQHDASARSRPSIMLFR